MSSSRPGDDSSRALAAAIRYTRAGVHASRDVLAYLTRRGVPPGTAARLVSACQHRGLVDDRACARLWADHWARRGYAQAAIRVKLSAKGLDERTIEQAIARTGAALDDDARARAFVAERARRGSGRGARSRLARTLASRGFDPDLIAQVLDEPWGPTPSDAER